MVQIAQLVSFMPFHMLLIIKANIYWSLSCDRHHATLLTRYISFIPCNNPKGIAVEGTKTRLPEAIFGLHHLPVECP